VLERTWQSKLAKSLREQGAVVLVKHGNSTEGPGWPDLYVAHRQWTGWLELKIEPNKPTQRQRSVMQKLRSQGVEVYTLVWMDEGCWDLRGGCGVESLTTMPGDAAAILPRLAMVRDREDHRRRWK
jgi:hypothetical protein